MATVLGVTRPSMWATSRELGTLHSDAESLVLMSYRSYVEVTLEGVEKSYVGAL